MRITVTLDDELLDQARSYTGIQETAALVQQALISLVQREAAKRLASLGSSSPKLQPAPRRCFDASLHHCVRQRHRVR